jgi:hypothetical protein
MRFTIIIITACTLFVGCANPRQSSSGISPAQAVLAAAERPISGTFVLEVRGTGRQDEWLYLNSEADYRDQRCLTIAIPKEVAADLQVKMAGDPESILKGKKIRVSGTARRVTIWFYSNGMKSDKYYFQTQVRVSDASQIVVL